MRKVFNIVFSGCSLVIVFALMQWFFWNGIKIGEGENIDVIWKGTRSEKPDLSIVPDVPTAAAVKALSFGDEQFYFRKAAFDIQNAGDTFGRTTSLQDYNYAKLYKWWIILDGLDPVSNFVPPLVSYYFGSSQKPKRDLPYVIDYLEQHADRDPGKKWWWYSQAIYHAKHKLKDLDRALILANKLANIPEDAGAPLWARQMPAFILEAKGDINAACSIIINIVENNKDISEGELNFMMYFVRDRISAMIEAQKDNPDLVIDPRCMAIIEVEKQRQADGNAPDRAIYPKEEKEPEPSTSNNDDNDNKEKTKI